MNRAQFSITLGLSILFAVFAIWGAMAAQTTGTLLARQQALQGGIENARMQQKILEQILQRTAIVGRQDPDILNLLKKYGIRVTSAPADPPPPVSKVVPALPQATPAKAKK